jgi:hypothetical protein
MTITNVADPATRLALMYEAVAMLCSDAKFGLVISHQVMSFIDGLARSPKVAVGNGFDQIVPLVLPQLCALVPARDLRVHFRNKLVHEFGILPPYAIGWDEAAYFSTVTVNGAQWKVVDARAMADEFIRYLRSPAALAEQKSRQGIP